MSVRIAVGAGKLREVEAVMTSLQKEFEGNSEWLINDANLAQFVRGEAEELRNILR